MSERTPFSALAALARRPRTRFIAPRPMLGPVTTIILILALAALGLAFLVLDPLAVAWQRGLPEWFVFPFRYLTYFGLSGVFLWPVGIAMVLLALLHWTALERSAKLAITALEVRLTLIFLAIGAPSLLAAIAKRLIGRLRPPAFDTHGHLAFEPIGWRAIAQGFPSGHATTAFAAAIVLGAIWPRARAPLFILAALIALSRVVLGSHYPSDGIGGAIFGALVAGLVVRAFAARRLALGVTAEGRVRPMAGPSKRRLAALAGSIRDALRRPRPHKSAADESAG